MRHEGTILIGRKGNEYWFVDSVFKHNDDFAGTTGSVVVPILKARVDFDCQPAQLAERFEDYWAEEARTISRGQSCPQCRFGPNEDGCMDCGYDSLDDFCKEVLETDGWKSLYDYPGDEYRQTLHDYDIKAAYTDCVSGGRIFGRADVMDFDEVYNRKALVALMAYEDGAVDYDYAVKAVFAA